MKRFMLTFVCPVLLATTAPGQEEATFQQYFLDRTLRVDYYRTGDKTDDIISLDQIYEQGPWAGNPHSLLDPSGNGRSRVNIYDLASNRLLYSRGYDTYFGEYRTSEPAKNGIKRTYHETVLTPFPQKPILFVIERRDRNNLYHPYFTLRIDPTDYHIIRETVRRNDQIYDLVHSGDPHNTVDLVIVAEGYTAAEKQKFEKDARHYADVFLSWEPYRNHRDKFNIRAIFSPSPESGVDEPRQGVYRNTLLGATFNALDSDRYLLTESDKLLHDIVAQVPCDAIMIMVNTKRYGGGGIYNFYTIFSSDGPWNEFVFHHEFAHAFAGLADEYYTTDVSYDQFFPAGVEPTEPNITALLDPAQLKWKDLVTPGLPIPTPWGQEHYDSLTTARDSIAAARLSALEKLTKRSASKKEIDESEATFAQPLKDLGDRMKKFFLEHPLRGKVGAFEGAGYVPKGFYRPTINSLMNQFDQKEKTFYPVNEQAIVRVIDYYTR